MTDDVRLFEVPKLSICALRFTETARARIVKVRARHACRAAARHRHWAQCTMPCAHARRKRTTPVRPLAGSGTWSSTEERAGWRAAGVSGCWSHSTQSAPAPAAACSSGLQQQDGSRRHISRQWLGRSWGVHIARVPSRPLCACAGCTTLLEAAGGRGCAAHGGSAALVAATLLRKLSVVGVRPAQRRSDWVQPAAGSC